MIFPGEFTSRVREELPEAEELLQSLEQPPPVSIRWNPAKKIPGVITDPVPWCPYGEYLPERPSFVADPLWHAGTYYVQEASSMFLHHLLEQVFGDEKDIVALDLCAAPGGKSTLVAGWLNGRGLLLSNEVIKDRASVLQENLTKWGGCNTLVSRNDPAEFSGLDGLFDLVVIDAPCSGEGMFRKDPVAVKEWSIQNLELCVARQERILEQATTLVKTGGYLVYSTCTFHKGENEEQVKRLLEDGWEMVLIQSGFEPMTVNTGRGYYFYPHRVKGEGLFMTMLRKTGDTLPGNFSAKGLKVEKVQVPFHLPEHTGIFSLFGKYWLLPQTYDSEIAAIARQLRLIKAGTEVGEWKGKDFIPAPGLALDPFIKTDYPAANVDLKTAQQFLSRATVDPALFEENGWNLVQYENVSLGWVKKMPNRVNNYYPVYWRIRTEIL